METLIFLFEYMPYTTCIIIGAIIALAAIYWPVTLGIAAVALAIWGVCVFWTQILWVVAIVFVLWGISKMYSHFKFQKVC